MHEEQERAAVEACEAFIRTLGLGPWPTHRQMFQKGYLASLAKPQPVGGALTDWKIKKDEDGWIYFSRPDNFRQAITPNEPLGSHAESLYMLLVATLSAPAAQPGEAVIIKLVEEHFRSYAHEAKTVFLEFAEDLLQLAAPPAQPSESAPTDEAIKEAISNATGFDWKQGELQPMNAHDLFNIARAILSLAAPAQAAAVPEDIASIIENLHTQDNRITQDPLFAVQQKRIVAGLDADYADQFAWICDGSEVDREEAERLDALRRAGEPIPDDCRRVGFIEKWEFVTGCLTEQGCKDYIACNGHNMKEPRIYAYGSYRNAEFIALRKWLMSLRIDRLAAPEADKAAAVPNAVVEEFYCNKCGYVGPVQYPHNRPNHYSECGYMASRIARLAAPEAGAGGGK